MTFSDRGSPAESPERGICHTVEPGEDDVVWWFGFDRAHWRDLCPAYKQYGGESLTYKNIEFVKQQCHILAKQLVEVTR